MNAPNSERLRELLARAGVESGAPFEAFAGEVLGRDGDCLLGCYSNAAHGYDARSTADLIAATLNALPALLHQLAERDAEVQDLKQRLATGRAHRRAIIQDFCNERDRAEAAECARDEATGLLREVAAWRLTVPPIAETPRKDGGIFGRIAAFLAASGGK